MAPVRSDVSPGERDTLSLWDELQATRVVLDEVAEEFDGEDPLKPAFREDLGQAIEQVQRVREMFCELFEQVELPEAGTETVEEVRALIKRMEEMNR